MTYGKSFIKFFNDVLSVNWFCFGGSADVLDLVLGYGKGEGKWLWGL